MIRLPWQREKRRKTACAHVSDAKCACAQRAADDNDVRDVSRGERGESITEVLVSILIGGLALLMMATAIASSVNIVRTGNEAMNGYYAFANEVASNGPDGESGEIEITDGTETVTVGVTIHEWSNGDSTRIVSYESQS